MGKPVFTYGMDPGFRYVYDPNIRSQSVTCKNCQARIPAGSLECPSCGATIELKTEDKTKIKVKHGQKKEYRDIIFIAGIVLLVVIIYLLLVFLL